MRIRSVTCFIDPRTRYTSNLLEKIGALARAAQEMYTKAGIEVQTLRLSTTPFPFFGPADDVDSAVRLAQTLEREARQQGFQYLSLGPAMPSQPESYQMVIPILSATQDVFLSGLMAPLTGSGQSSEISPKAVRACAEIIQAASTVTPDGFTNLRFAALANVPSGGPFFPGSYHRGERPAFALAIECADVAFLAARKAASLSEFRQEMIDTLEAQATSLSSKANHLAQQFDVDFKGIDFSLAPFPAEWCSLGSALEALGLPALGQSGSLAAAAFMASTLDSGSWLRVGFNGLMMPVLEDSTLAARAAQGSLLLQDVLMYSAVCGTGLDTVPLPGDTTAEQIYPILMDVSALALRLNKPLTARLMPIPGKSAGDPTDFDFSFFASSRVMALRAAPLKGLLGQDKPFVIKARG